MALAFYRPIPADNDLRATAIDGALVTDVGVETAYTVTVYNNGTVAQSTYDVKLMADEGTELATTAGTAIEPGEAIDFTFNWTPDSGGTYNLYGQTVLAGDENTDNEPLPADRGLCQSRTRYGSNRSYGQQRSRCWNHRNLHGFGRKLGQRDR